MTETKKGDDLMESLLVAFKTKAQQKAFLEGILLGLDHAEMESRNSIAYSRHKISARIDQYLDGEWMNRR